MTILNVSAVIGWPLRGNSHIPTRKDITTMTAPHIVDPAGVLKEALSDASPDLMRSLLQTMINALL